jgi:hypothetical protein
VVSDNTFHSSGGDLVEPMASIGLAGRITQGTTLPSWLSSNF